MKKLTRQEFNKLMKIYLDLGEDALYLNHYQLAGITDHHDAQDWKIFLTDPTIVDYVNTEMALIRNAAINDMVHKAPDSNSVGQSQLINALQKIDEKKDHKEGPVFIYTYVPLNSKQEEAPNIRKIENKEITKTDEGWEFEEIEIEDLPD